MGRNGDVLLRTPRITTPGLQDFVSSLIEGEVRDDMEKLGDELSRLGLGVKPSTSASGLQPSSNTKKDKIQRTPSITQKNKVEAHPRTVKSSLKNKNCVVESKGTANMQHSMLNANFKLICVKCNGCMLYDNHDLCVLNFINDVNARAKSKFVKKISKRKVWKLTGKMITTTIKVPPRKLSALETDTPKPVVTLVYSRKPRKSKTNVPVNKPKIIKSISANNKEPSKSWGSIVFDVPSSSFDECSLVRLSRSLVRFFSKDGSHTSVAEAKVHVLEFEVWTAEMRRDLAVSFEEVYSGEGQQVFVSHAWRWLLDRVMRSGWRMDLRQCSAFNEFNYLLKVDPDLLTKDIMGFKTYEDYKDDWIYEWNKDVPWVYDKPWLDKGIWKEPTPFKHT
ncbi:hypothetical protein Tco_0609396 [Tanacetum coccineum]